MRKLRELLGADLYEKVLVYIEAIEPMTDEEYLEAISTDDRGEL